MAQSDISPEDWKAIELKKKMKAFVTGAAGFIGSNLVDRLLQDGWDVTGWDNLSTGKLSFLKSANASNNFRLIIGDNLDLAGLSAAMLGADVVFHLAANADVRHGLEHPDRDLQQNTVATFNILEAMRESGSHDIVFSSTGSVYGEATIIPTPENHPFPIQTSLYGASKLAGEGLIAAYHEGYGINATIFRFVSILGPRYTHGHIIDFVRQLRKDPSKLSVLGDGMQRKSYLHVDDCVEALVGHGLEGGLNIFNLGTTESITVNESVAVITSELRVKPEIQYSGGSRGWIGDNPHIELDTSKIRALGWKPQHSIVESVQATTQWLVQNLEDCNK